MRQETEEETGIDGLDDVENILNKDDGGDFFLEEDEVFKISDDWDTGQQNVHKGRHKTERRRKEKPPLEEK